MDLKTLEFKLPNECNLHCIYCNTPRHNLDIDINYDLLNDLFEEPFTNINLTSTNTEPFNSIDFLSSFTKYINYLSVIHDKEFKICLVTNGTLINDVRVKEYLDRWYNNLEIGFSINGPKDIQDFTRPNSFDRLMENYKSYKDTRVCKPSVTLFPEFADRTFEIFEFVLSNFKCTGITWRTVRNYPVRWNANLYNVIFDQLCKVSDYINKNGLKINLNLFNKYDLEPSDYIYKDTIIKDMRAIDPKCEECNLSINRFVCNLHKYDQDEKFNRCQFMQLTKKLMDYTNQSDL